MSTYNLAVNVPSREDLGCGQAIRCSVGHIQVCSVVGQLVALSQRVELFYKVSE